MPDSDLDRAIYKSHGNSVAAGVITALLLGVAIAAVIYGLIFVANATKEILVSVVAAMASLLSAVFAYVFQRAKELEMAAMQKKRELELAERKTKQENYARILERLAPFVRNPVKSGDDFTTAYLHTWVVGPGSVIRSVGEFLRERNAASLDLLLMAMRRDLQIDRDDENIPWERQTSKGLFPVSPPPPPEEGLKE